MDTHIHTHFSCKRNHQTGAYKYTQNMRTSMCICTHTHTHTHTTNTQHNNTTHTHTHTDTHTHTHTHIDSTCYSTSFVEWTCTLIIRSEERRVGRECRSLCSPYH